MSVFKISHTSDLYNKQDVGIANQTLNNRHITMSNIKASTPSDFSVHTSLEGNDYNLG